MKQKATTMSIEGLRTFGRKLEEDQAFNDQVRSVVEGAAPDQAAEAAARLAQASGCDVTAEEIARGLEQRGKGQGENAELTEEELEQVSGGLFGWPSWWPLVLSPKPKPKGPGPKISESRP